VSVLAVRPNLAKINYIQMKYLTISLLLVVSLFSFMSFKVEEPSLGKHNIAYKWGKIALELTANDTERFRPRPTVTSRYLGLVFTAIFDAWSRYDKKATPLYLSNVERQQNQSLKNKETAISYAAYRILLHYYYSDSLLLKKYFIQLGYHPQNQSLDPHTPEGIGNLAAKAVIDARQEEDKSDELRAMSDEWLQLKNHAHHSSQHYKPVNSPDTLVDINHWQPKYFSDGKGGKFAPSCLTPYWYKIKPLALTSADQFRCPPPPLVGSEQLKKEVAEVVSLQAKLTAQDKALVEFMRDGPKSVQQAGHWLLFAQDISVRDNHTLDDDVKMYFLVEMTAMDAFIAAWDTKMYYDFARPYALVHHYYKDKKIKGWAGEGYNFQEIDGQNWRPYSPNTFLCPPFPSYVSGHSCVSAGCAEALRLFTGSDVFAKKVELLAGSMTEPTIHHQKVILSFPTFTETANMAGWSRVLGGYHIQADNIEGLKLGRSVAKTSWEKYLAHTSSTHH
jgi:PAP2 superfamily